MVKTRGSSWLTLPQAKCASLLFLMSAPQKLRRDLQRKRQKARDKQEQRIKSFKQKWNERMYWARPVMVLQKGNLITHKNLDSNGPAYFEDAEDLDVKLVLWKITFLNRLVLGFDVDATKFWFTHLSWPGEVALDSDDEEEDLGDMDHGRHRRGYRQGWRQVPIDFDMVDSNRDDNIKHVFSRLQAWREHLLFLCEKLSDAF